MQIRDAVCVEITTVTPGEVCIAQTQDVTLDGSGFFNNLDPNSAICRFQLGNEMKLSKFDATNGKGEELEGEELQAGKWEGLEAGQGEVEE